MVIEMKTRLSMPSTISRNMSEIMVIHASGVVKTAKSTAATVLSYWSSVLVQSRARTKKDPWRMPRVSSFKTRQAQGQDVDGPHTTYADYSLNQARIMVTKALKPCNGILIP